MPEGEEGLVWPEPRNARIQRVTVPHRISKNTAARFARTPRTSQHLPVIATTPSVVADVM